MECLHSRKCKNTYLYNFQVGRKMVGGQRHDKAQPYSTLKRGEFSLPNLYITKRLAFHLYTARKNQPRPNVLAHPLLNA